MIDRNTWNGHPVTFAEFSIRDGRAVIDAFARNGEQGSFELLVKALRYTASGEPVFASVDEVMDQPFRLRDRIAYLAGKCAFANGMRDGDPEMEVAPGAQPNGHAEGPGPSL